VTAFWLEQCISSSSILGSDQCVLFRPVPFLLPIPGFTSFKFSISGFQAKHEDFHRRRDVLVRMIEVSGATFTERLSRSGNTHLVFESTESEKYRKAREWGIQVVSWEWLVCTFRDGHVPPGKDLPENNMIGGKRLAGPSSLPTKENNQKASHQSPPDGHVPSGKDLPENNETGGKRLAGLSSLPTKEDNQEARNQSPPSSLVKRKLTSPKPRSPTDTEGRNSEYTHVNVYEEQEVGGTGDIVPPGSPFVKISKTNKPAEITPLRPLTDKLAREESIFSKIKQDMDKCMEEALANPVSGKGIRLLSSSSSGHRRLRLEDLESESRKRPAFLTRPAEEVLEVDDDEPLPTQIVQYRTVVTPPKRKRDMGSKKSN